MPLSSRGNSTFSMTVNVVHEIEKLKDESNVRTPKLGTSHFAHRIDVLATDLDHACIRIINATDDIEQ